MLIRSLKSSDESVVMCASPKSSQSRGDHRFFILVLDIGVRRKELKKEIARLCFPEGPILLGSMLNRSKLPTTPNKRPPIVRSRRLSHPEIFRAGRGAPGPGLARRAAGKPGPSYGERPCTRGVPEVCPNNVRGPLAWLSAVLWKRWR